MSKLALYEVNIRLETIKDIYVFNHDDDDDFIWQTMVSHIDLIQEGLVRAMEIEIVQEYATQRDLEIMMSRFVSLQSGHTHYTATLDLLSSSEGEFLVFIANEIEPLDEHKEYTLELDMLNKLLVVHNGIVSCDNYSFKIDTN